MPAIPEWLRAAFHDPRTATYRVVSLSVGTLILLSCLLLVLELTRYGETGAPVWLEVVDVVILVFFAIEVSLRIATFRPPEVEFFDMSAPRRLEVQVLGRLRFCLSPLVLIDLITVAALVPALRGLRALRLLRLARTPSWFRYSSPIEGLARAFRENALLFGFGLSVLASATLIGGTSIFLLESAAAPVDRMVHTLTDGIWWAIVTLTTVGFGDTYPVTGLGRVLGAGLMIVGMFTLALFAGIVGNTLLNSVLTIRQEQFRMTGYLNHIVICGWDAGSSMLLDALSQEFDYSDAQLVVFSVGERPLELPPEYIWVPGDPTKDSELPKVRMARAAAVVVVGARQVPPQTADAASILSVFTIRSFMRQHTSEKKRKKPLHIVVEILESENVEHARVAGADEVVETKRVGFAMLAHAVAQPGVADVLTRVTSAGEQSLFSCDVPDGYELPMTFESLARELKADRGALLIGIRDPLTDSESINPPNDTSVSVGCELLYLAPRALD